MAIPLWNPSPGSPPEALIFDLMGTVCDWHSALLPALSSSPTIPDLDLRKLAAEWRAGFFTEIQTRFQSGLPAEDIDITHRRVLDHLLEQVGVSYTLWNEEVRGKLVRQWHYQVGWPDALPALERLRKKFFM